MMKNMIKEENVRWDYNNMPAHIKKFFLYRKAYRDIWVRKKNTGLIVTGATGSGKSEFALKLAEDLDPTFNIERVVYTAEDFLELLLKGDSKGKIGIGKAIIFDETSHDEAMDSRSSLSANNKQMAALSTIYRAMRLIVIYVAPNLNQIDSRVRAISITGLFQMKNIDYVRQVSKADFFWSVQNPRSGDVYYKRPRLIKNGRRVVCMSISLGRPSRDLRLAYEKKKMAFIKRKLERWHNATKELNLKEQTKKVNVPITEIVADVLKNKKEFEVKGKINIVKIMERFEIGVDKAKIIASFVRNSVR
jgi:hypothetical protein